MNKKIVLVILVLIVLSGCSSRTNFCKSKGYEDYRYASQWNCGDVLPCGYFYCYNINCNGTMSFSEVYGENYRSECNPEPKPTCD